MNYELSKNDVRDFINMAWDNLLTDNLELILYNDGLFALRQIGSLSIFEEDVIYILSLDTTYWIDSDFVKVDNEDVKKDNKTYSNFVERMSEAILDVIL